MPSLTDGEVVQNFQSRALKLTRELECVRRDNAERERELSAAEKVVILLFCCVLAFIALRFSPWRMPATCGCRPRPILSFARLKKLVMR